MLVYRLVYYISAKTDQLDFWNLSCMINFNSTNKKPNKVSVLPITFNRYSKSLFNYMLDFAFVSFVCFSCCCCYLFCFPLMYFCYSLWINVSIRKYYSWYVWGTGFRGICLPPPRKISPPPPPPTLSEIKKKLAFSCTKWSMHNSLKTIALI